MFDQIYADTDSLSAFMSSIYGYCQAILKASSDFYRTVASSNWSDDLTEVAVDRYKKIVKIVEEILQTVDGTQVVLKEQLDDLQAYLSVKI